MMPGAWDPETWINSTPNWSGTPTGNVPWHDSLRGSVGIQPNSKNVEPYMRRMYSTAMLPGLMSGAKAYNAFMPMKTQAVRQGAYALDPANNQAKLDKFRRSSMSTAGDAAQIAALILGEQGYGSGHQAGAGLEAVNQATTATNDYASQLQSPEYLQQAYMALIQLLNAGMIDPNAGLMSGMMGGQFQQTPKAPGFLGSTVMPLLGMAAQGLDWNKLLGLGAKAAA